MKAILLLATLLTPAISAPLAAWSPALGEFYAAVDRHIQQARQEGTAAKAPTCDLSRASQPIAPTPLPTPDPSWVLSEVVVGRGVQNYTCSSASKDVAPKAVGAVASLYNVSCIASNYPDILSMLPGLTLQYALPAQSNGNLQPSNLELVGHHYFSSNGTPIFDMTELHPLPDAAKVKVATLDLGVGRFKARSNSTAPADAPKGEDGSGNGAVPWLLLDAIFGTTSDLTAVYRLNTAGGKAPATCESSPAAFSVQYGAEYWFYTNPGSKVSS